MACCTTEDISLPKWTNWCILKDTRRWRSLHFVILLFICEMFQIYQVLILKRASDNFKKDGNSDK